MDTPQRYSRRSRAAEHCRSVRKPPRETRHQCMSPTGQKRGSRHLAICILKSRAEVNVSGSPHMFVGAAARCMASKDRHRRPGPGRRNRHRLRARRLVRGTPSKSQAAGLLPLPAGRADSRHPCRPRIFGSPFAPRHLPPGARSTTVTVLRRALGRSPRSTAFRPRAFPSFELQLRDKMVVAHPDKSAYMRAIDVAPAGPAGIGRKSTGALEVVP